MALASFINVGENHDVAGKKGLIIATEFPYAKSTR
jgi:hypothetical protein